MSISCPPITDPVFFELTHRSVKLIASSHNVTKEIQNNRCHFSVLSQPGGLRRCVEWAPDNFCYVASRETILSHSQWTYVTFPWYLFSGLAEHFL